MSFRRTKALCCWLFVSLTVLFFFVPTEQAHARTMTCESSTLNTFKTVNQSSDLIGVLVLAETSSFVWHLDRDTCGVRSYDTSWSQTETCSIFLDATPNSDEALAICGIGRDPTSGLGFARDGANLTNVTLYQGKGSTSGVNVARETYRTLNANTYYRVTYNTENDGRRVLTFTTNSALNGLADSTITAYTDSDRPTLTISDVPARSNSATPFTITILANEDIVGLTIDDISLTNATASNLTTVTDYRRFTVTITPDGNGDVTIQIPEGAVTDLADHTNYATATLTSEYNTEAPIVTISGVPSTTDGSTSFIAYYNFTYADRTVASVSGFDIDDVTAALVNATASNFTEDLLGNGAKYWATITPDGNGSVSVGVNANAAQDASGFGNLAATTQVATMPDTTAPTVVVTNDGPKTGGEAGTLNGSGSSDAGGIASYAWTQVDAVNSDTTATTNVVSLSSTSTSAPTFTVPSLTTNANLYFKLTVTDNADNSASAWTTFAVVENTAPSVSIITNSPGAAGSTATLNGSGSTDAGGIASYTWVQVDALDSDTALTSSDANYATLTDADTSQASFTVPSFDTDTNLFFKLTVTDNAGNSASAWTTYVASEDVRPVVTEVTPVTTPTNDPTPDVVIQSDQTGIVNYNGGCQGDVSSISQVNTDITIALRTGGSGGDLSDGTYSGCTITVTNSTNGSSEPYTLTSFTVDTTDPVADAAASAQPSAGQTGTLDGSASTDTGGSGIASYAWAQVDALNSDTAASTNVVTLTNADAAQATFTVPSLSANGELYFKLTVTDNAGNSASDWVTYDVNEDTRPTATTVTITSTNGDPTTARTGDTVTLSFTTSEALTVNNPQVALQDGGGNTLAGTLSGSGSSWSYSYTLAGTETDGAITFTIDLTNDSGEAGEQITALVNDTDGDVTIDNTAPSASASNNSAQTGGAGGASGELYSTGSSDSGSGIAAYAWVQVSGDGSDQQVSSLSDTYAALTNANTSTATFTVPRLSANASLYFKLTVTDNAGNSSSVWTTYAVTADTTAPTVSSVAFQDSSGSITSADPGDSFTVVVTFSETMDTTSPPSLAFYDATDGSGNSIDLSSWAQTGSDGWSSSDTVYTFNFTVPSTLATSVAVRSTTVSGIDDVNGNALSDHTENDTFDVNENTAPTVSSVVFQDSTGTSASSADPGDSFRVVVTFSEAMDTTSPPSLAFYDATGGTGNSIDLSSWAQTGSDGWSSSDTVYTFNFTVPSTLATSVAIRSTTVSGIDDVAGNALSDHTENDTFDVIENTAPTVSSVVFQDSGGSTITSASPGSSFRVVVTFSEAMDTDTSSTSPPSIAFHDATGGTGNAVDLSSWAQTASNGWSSSDTVYTFNFTAPSTLAASVAIRSTTVSSIDDAAGNALSDHTENDTFDVIENTAPTVSSVVFQDSGGSATSADPGDSFQVVVTFSEAMDTASPPSLTFYDATGGTGNTVDLSSWAQTGSDGWSSSDTVYTFNFTAPSTLAASVAIRSTTVSGIDDAAGNALSDHTENDTFDVNENTAPTVTSVVFQDSSGAITSADPGDSFTVIVTFSEAMDTSSPPSLAFYDATGGTGNTVDLSSWAQTGSNGWSSSDTVYTFNFTIPSPLAVSVAVRSTEVSSASDVAGNALVDHTEDDSLDVIENTAPTLITVAIASDNATDTSQATIGDQIALSFTASEALGSTPTVSIANTSVTPTNISGNTWVATLTVDDTTPTGLVTFTISNLVDTNSNAASNVTTTTDNSSVTIDTVAPTLTISAPDEARGSFTATFTFSEDVTGFELADITVGNGTASDFAGSDDVYTATITPTEHGDVTLDVAAAVAIDGAGNDNAAADQVTVNYIDENYVRQRTQRIISNFMTRRGDAIVSNQPDLTERLNQAGPGNSGAGASFTGEGSYANNRMAFATSLRQMLAANKANKDQRIAGLQAGSRSGLGAGLEDRQKEGPQDGLKIGQQGGGMQSLGFRTLSANDGAPAGFDLWIRGRWARYESDTNQGDLGLLFIGADYKFNNNFVLGVVAQFDWTDEVDDTDDFKINGRGWMVGPYLVAQLHQNLIFDANFSWGQSDNEVSPFNTYTDSFDGTRWLASAKFTGSFTFGNLHVAPHIGVLYFQERQEAYVDSLSIDIPEQTVKLGRLSFGPKVSTTFQRKDGTTISPYLGIKGLWDFERSAIVDLTTGLASESTDDLRARVDAGITIRLPDGLTLNGEGFYDGLGTQDYKSYGGSIRINIPLQRNGEPTAAMKLGVGASEPTTSYQPAPAGAQPANGNAAGKR